MAGHVRPSARGDRAGPIAALFFFSVLTALMLRPARDALGMEHGIESVRSLIVVTALVTLAVNPLFGWIVSRIRRLQFISATYGFLVLSLVGFWYLMRFAPSAVSQASSQVFYIWFNVFNLFVTMVFCALLADRFSSDQGKRFRIDLRRRHPRRDLRALAHIAAGQLAGHVESAVGRQRLPAPGMLTAWLLLRIAPDRETEHGTAASRANEAERIDGSAWAGVRSVIRSPYLSGIASYVMPTALMVTFVYFTRLQMVAEIAEDLDTQAAILGKIDMWTYIAVLTLQLTLETDHQTFRPGHHACDGDRAPLIPQRRIRFVLVERPVIRRQTQSNLCSPS